MTLPPGWTLRDTVLWLAGLLDGEGCFQWASRAPRIQLGMADLDTVTRAHAALGATGAIVLVRKQRGREHHKQQFFFTVCGTLAAGWMMMLWPYLCARRQQAILAVLARWRARPPAARYRRACPRGHPLVRYHGRRYCPVCQQHHDSGRYRGGRRLGRRPDTRTLRLL